LFEIINAHDYDVEMSHLRRLRTTDRVFFVTVRLRQNLPAISDDEFRLLLQAIEKSRHKLHFWLCGYVLMPDHWHALIAVRHPLTISRAIQDIKWISAQSINRHRQVSGALWQHQFWDRFVRHEKELAARIDYMHGNPVKKGLAERPEEWLWSSYNNYSLDAARVAACPIRIDYFRLSEDYRA
jgi:putative transposase